MFGGLSRPGPPINKCSMGYHDVIVEIITLAKAMIVGASENETIRINTSAGRFAKGSCQCILRVASGPFLHIRVFPTDGRLQPEFHQSLCFVLLAGRMNKRWIRNEQAKREDARTASQNSLVTKDKRTEGQSRSINSLQRYCDLHTPHGYGGYTSDPVVLLTSASS